MLDNITKIMLIMLIVFQFVMIIQMIYINCKRYKEDKKFWAKQDEISEEFLKNAKALREGDVAVEQEDTDKK